PELGQMGDVRLAGFSSGTNLCGPSGFCLVLDGASGGNNAMAILAFLAAYEKSGRVNYLNDARTIGNWIANNLADMSNNAYGGFFVGYNDGGLPKSLLVGKSTADNAQIFAAFSRLAQAEQSFGNTTAIMRWTAMANSAGDFVSKMFDAVNGRFAAGTIPSQGGEAVNTADSLDSDSLASLAMITASRYQSIDWRRPIRYLLNNF